MRKSAKIITALSVTGLAVVAGSAFTGSGLQKSGEADNNAFIGGTVKQVVDGATLSDINYSVTDDGNANATKISGATLTFTEAIPTTSTVWVKFDNGIATECDATPLEGGGLSATEFKCQLVGFVTSVNETFVTVKTGTGTLA